jgi:hypothetical protein
MLVGAVGLWWSDADPTTLVGTLDQHRSAEARAYRPVSWYDALDSTNPRMSAFGSTDIAVRAGGLGGPILGRCSVKGNPDGYGPD